MSTISRIAPTPSGYLHFGNAFNFLLVEKLVQEREGLLRLRIDDGDTDRVRPEYIDDIFESLTWLGIQWHAGPRNAEEQGSIYSQATQADRYEALIQNLWDGGHLFACTCSRRDIAFAGANGQYPGTCRHKGLPKDTVGASLRLLTPEDAIVSFTDKVLGETVLRPYERMRDFVVRRRDGGASYQLASVADDIAQNINLIVRGEDLLDSTGAQLWLAECACLPTFGMSEFHHHPLIREQDGLKLSKSAGSSSLQDMRRIGTHASHIREKFEKWLLSGWDNVVYRKG